MEALSIMGVAAFCLAVSLMGLPEKVKTLDKKIKKLSKRIEGDKSMSKLLEELVGKKCALYTKGVGVVGVVIAVDEDWVKVEIENKKGKSKIKLYPLDSFENIELMD